MLVEAMQLSFVSNSGRNVKKQSIREEYACLVNEAMERITVVVK